MPTTISVRKMRHFSYWHEAEVRHLRRIRPLNRPKQTSASAVLMSQSDPEQTSRVACGDW